MPQIVNKKSVLEMAMGAISEITDYEVERVMANIMDPNTNATAKRKITIPLTFAPDDYRQQIGMDAQAKTTLAPIQPVRTSLCITEDRDYLLALLSRIDVNQGVSSVDNGISQEVSVKTGAVLKEQQTVQPIVHLQPYRTFLEVEQPASDFLLRLDKEGHPALYEADGGAWKLEAKRNIAAYLGEKLADLIESGNVVVMI